MERHKIDDALSEMEHDIGKGSPDEPESQGKVPSGGFGRNAQGGFGDEDFDPSYQREEEGDEQAPTMLPEGAEPADVLPAEHEGPGRGRQGREYATQAPSRFAEGLVATGGEERPSETPAAALEEAVLERLTEELGIDPDDLTVRVENGVVVLEGLVDEPEIRRAAERFAAAVEGVESVVNQLRPRRGDDEA